MWKGDSRDFVSINEQDKDMALADSEGKNNLGLNETSKFKIQKGSVFVLGKINKIVNTWEYPRKNFNIKRIKNFL